MFFSVCAGQCSAVRKVLNWTGEPVPLRHCNSARLYHLMDALLAVCHHKVWKEDRVLCRHVGVHAVAATHALCTPGTLYDVPPGRGWGTGRVMCLLVTMVSMGSHVT